MPASSCFLLLLPPRPCRCFLKAGGTDAHRGTPTAGQTFVLPATHFRPRPSDRICSCNCRQTHRQIDRAALVFLLPYALSTHAFRCCEIRCCWPLVNTAGAFTKRSCSYQPD
ncbi:hypothetical protein FN846DRAFT_940852 [Sphaerosporella brunnea]|uniref:Uncharacterized protein n=1 Tax=Sphaerosporella brunnea TaxID=1250544 RepID=A0A5J5F303_9PEZI|nr:hypothetical protein FN846DRAFT_940852 [Sphaerosporella brunnea]